jgi:hypothetical protein
MYIDLTNIGKYHLKYGNPNQKNFDSVDAYITSARRIISYFGPKSSSALTQEMLASDDAVSNIATQLMLADWRWDEEYKNAAKTKRSKYSYRNQCGKWAVQAYITRRTKRRGKWGKTFSLDGSKVTTWKGDAKGLTSSNELEQVEVQEHNVSYVHKMLDSGILTEKQQKFIKLHYLEGESIKNIALANDISHQAVYLSIDNGLRKLKEFAHEHSERP